MHDKSKNKKRSGLSSRKAMNVPASDGRLIRATFIVPASLDKYLAVYALNEGTTKSAALQRALAKFLDDNGFDTTKEPKKITVEN